MPPLCKLTLQQTESGTVGTEGLERLAKGHVGGNAAVTEGLARGGVCPVEELITLHSRQWMFICGNFRTIAAVLQGLAHNWFNPKGMLFRFHMHSVL